MSQQSFINSLPLPAYWCPNGGSYYGKFTLSPWCEEYRKVEEVFYDCIKSNYYNYNIKNIKRIQNVEFYGKFFLRKQQLASYEFPTYMRRMLLVLPKDYLHDALEYNLDERITNIEMLLQESVNKKISKGSVVLIVNVLYSNEDDLTMTECHPYFSSEHYIEYIIELQ
nr:uncharacterized protein LOC111422771 [Onthophagus taurus]